MGRGMVGWDSGACRGFARELDEVSRHVSISVLVVCMSTEEKQKHALIVRLYHLPPPASTLLGTSSSTLSGPISAPAEQIEDVRRQMQQLPGIVRYHITHDFFALVEREHACRAKVMLHRHLQKTARRLFWWQSKSAMRMSRHQRAGMDQEAPT